MIIHIIRHYYTTSEFHCSLMSDTLSETVCWTKWGWYNHFHTNPCSPASSASHHVPHKPQSDITPSQSHEQKLKRAWERKTDTNTGAKTCYHQHLHTQTHTVCQAQVWSACMWSKELRCPWILTVLDGGEENPLGFSIITTSHCWEFTRSVYHQVVCQTFFNTNLSHFLISRSRLASQCTLAGKLEESAKTRIIIMWTEMWKNK